MILVLSCFDLVVVAIAHPLLILSTILWSMEIYHGEIEVTRVYTTTLLGGFSMFALLTLTIERFLALTYPFFHQTAVTKKGLLFFQAFLMATTVSASQLAHLYEKAVVLEAVFILFLLFVFVCLNYKMFIIAKSKRNDERVFPTGTATSRNQERKRRKLNFKNISTCSLAVGCFFVCSFPRIIYSAARFTSNMPFYNRQILLFNIWSVTSLFMNSTFNCLISFWRNSILRREGTKIAKRF
jgi:hypothetical protein